MAESRYRKVIPITAQAVWGSNFLYESEKKIYPRTVQGIFAQWRWFFVALTQLVFYGMPWLEWGQRQMVLFDLNARRFYMFGWVLYPQDFIYLTALLVICALSLFLFTAVAGRLWCGFACPQTVYSEIFMWIERKVEGNRTARMQLDESDFSLEKLVKKWYKHFLWITVAMWTGFTFVGYFTPIRSLVMEFFKTQMSSWEVFWVFFYALATYFNAGFLREQVCKYMCPYARFQSAMFDHDTLIVTYDQMCGEPRGARSRHDEHVANLGDCVDCTLCVQVCPTGIDIRQGLQYECIGCAACVDVCDGVMKKMGYPLGLIRFSTQNALANAWSSSQIWQRVRRPRVLIYTLLLLFIVCVFLISLALRTPLRVDVLHDRNSLARISEDGQIQNVYRLQLMNATEQGQTYRVAVTGMDAIRLSSENTFSVDATQSRWAVVRVDIPWGSATAGSHKIWFHIQAVDLAAQVTEASVFLVPH